jgi:serine/threonine protein kinase/tetratricopeptide (TPR) repeat protein
VNESQVFTSALKLATPAERAGYLDEVCAGNAELRAAVEALLRAHANDPGFLEQPAGSLSGTVDGPATPALDERLAQAGVPEQPGEVLGGRYKLLQLIGEGGFGVVFMAEQTQPVRRKVALKVLKPGMDTREVVARFEAERQALALMDHANIARVLDGGQTTSGRPYFVMDLVKGLPITDYCDHAQLAPRERLELFVQVCQAVQHAHQKGIIHRDLKPSNVLVTLHDGTPLVKVIDFGIAKALGQSLTDKTLFTGLAQMVGTPLYMSPEQAALSNIDVDTRSDIYALGVLLYELLTGTTPFDRKRLKEVGYDELRRIIREEEPSRPSTRISTLGQGAATVSTQRKSDPKQLQRLFRGEVDWMVMKALEKDRNRRYESASALAADVQRYLHDEPVQACPPSAAYRFRKFARRNKVVLSVTGVVLFFLALLGSGVGWAVRDRAARETDLAREKVTRRSKLNVEIERALDDVAKARNLALKLTDHPDQWKAALAEAASELKRAQGLAAQDETALEPATRERLEALQVVANSDESDYRFAAHFEEVRLQQTDVNLAISEFKTGIALKALSEAFQHHYQIEFGRTPAAWAAAIIQRRPRPIQEFLLAGLDVSLECVPKEDRQTRQWLGAVLDAADAGPWRKRAQQALKARDWKALEQVVEEAVAARQPPSWLLRLARETPPDSPIRITISRRVRRAYPGDFWANHDLACFLHYSKTPHLDEAIRYYTAALALRPGNPAACVNLGTALRNRGDLDSAICAYHDALDGHPDYASAHYALSMALEKKGDLDGAITELRQVIRLRNYSRYHAHLGSILTKKGRWHEAIASYDKAIELDPKYAVAWNNRGWSYNALGRCDKGLADLNQAIQLDPRCAAFWQNRADACAGLGQWDRASAEYSRSIQLNSESAISWCCRALLHLQVGDRAGYREECAAMRRHFGRSASPDSIGLTVWTCVQVPDAVSDWNLLAQWAEKTLRAHPKGSIRLTALGAVMYRAGRLDEAVRHLNEAEAAFVKTNTRLGTIAYAWLFRAMAEQCLGHAMQAREWFDKAVREIEHPPPERGDALVRGNWNRQLSLRLLRSEAEDLLGINKQPQK